MVQSMELYIGIDLGTTNSCVGWWRGSRGVQIIPNEQGQSTTHSSVAFQGNGKTIVGMRASQHINWVYDAKRFIGRSIREEEVQEMMKMINFNIQPGDR